MQRQNIILVFSGSFNPIHTGHVKVLTTIKDALDRGNMYNVVKAYVAPSSDQYVKQKLGKDAIDLEHRCAMCHIACKEYKWIDVCHYGEPSGGKTKYKLIENRLVDRRTRVFEVGGMDFVQRSGLDRGYKPFICVGRKGYNSHITSNGDFIVIEKDLENISSTDIRNCIHNRDFVTPVQKGWIKSEVMDYMKSLYAQPNIVNIPRQPAQVQQVQPMQRERRGINDELVRVWQDTRAYFEKNPRNIPKPMKINIYSLHEIKDNPSVIDKHVTEVINDDTFNLAIQYINSGLHPMVLNMASDYIPGGGVAKGCPAQEEELFRRSNAHQTHPRAWYPLKDDEILYSPEVTIIKDKRANNYQLIKEVKVSMFACAALRKPNLNNGKYYDDDYQMMSDKIESMFMMGIAMKHDSLVLGAFGCGAFYNPPTEVAKIFATMINKYGKYFKKIGFAILCIRPSDNENLSEFKRILSA